MWPEQAQARRAIQQMNDQNQRRMAAEMRRAKEAKEQAEKDAKAAILREQRAKLARRQAAENEKKQEEEEQIQRTLDRKRRAAEERELTLKAMCVPRHSHLRLRLGWRFESNVSCGRGKMSESRETALELYRQAMAG